MSALTSSGNVGQAAITTSRSGQISRLSGENAALSAALGNSLDKVEFAKRLASKEFEGSWTGVTPGLSIRWLRVRVPSASLAAPRIASQITGNAGRSSLAMLCWEPAARQDVAVCRFKWSPDSKGGSPCRYNSHATIRIREHRIRPPKTLRHAVIS